MLFWSPQGFMKEKVLSYHKTNFFCFVEYSSELNMTQEAVSQNILLLNVFFSRAIQWCVCRYTEIHIKDLFFFIRGNIGLFLGMSFIGFHDIGISLHAPCFTLHMKIKENKRKQRLREIRMRYRKGFKRTNKVRYAIEMMYAATTIYSKRTSSN